MPSWLVTNSLISIFVRVKLAILKIVVIFSHLHVKMTLQFLKICTMDPKNIFGLVVCEANTTRKYMSLFCCLQLISICRRVLLVVSSTCTHKATRTSLRFYQNLLSHLKNICTLIKMVY